MIFPYPPPARDEIYDLKTLTPIRQFLTTYEKVMREIEDLGVDFRY